MAVYPAPAGEVLSSEYAVVAESQKVDVYTARVLDPPFAGKAVGFSAGRMRLRTSTWKAVLKVKVTAKRSLVKCCGEARSFPTWTSEVGR